MLYALSFIGGIVATCAVLVGIATGLRMKQNKQLAARKPADADAIFQNAEQPLRRVPFDSPIAKRIALLDDYWAAIAVECRGGLAIIFTCEVCDANPVLCEGDRNDDGLAMVICEPCENKVGEIAGELNAAIVA